MALSVTRLSLEVNGQVVNDFKAFNEKARVLRKAVPLMYRTNTAQLTQRYEVEIDYVVPQINPFVFDTVEGGTLTVEYDSGERTEFGGVSCAEVGDAMVDGENELVKKIRLTCETRNGNTGGTIEPT